jgi:hypothetical protein
MGHLLGRVNLSFRNTRLTIDDEACAHFRVHLAAVQAEFPAEDVLNFDQSDGSR